MKKRTILALAIFAAAVVASAGYLISSEVTNCLYQPSITEVQPRNIRFQVYHYTTDDSCAIYCAHDCSTDYGTIQVEVYDSNDERIAGPYDMTNDRSDTCYTYWTCNVTDDLTGASYARFSHKNRVDCYVTVDFE